MEEQQNTRAPEPWPRKEMFEPLHGKAESRVDAILLLIREASTNLPGDVISSLSEQKAKESDGSQAQRALGIILENIEIAYDAKTPICQDTGTNIFHVHYPVGTSTIALRNEITQAVRRATELGYLRPNSVDSITGKNSGDNTGIGLPSLYFHEWEKDHLEIKLMLKGGGCENVGAQYALPESRLGAGRDLAGVKKVVLDAVLQAQGRGCSPGILGVGIGGDRVSGALLAKEQLFRTLEDQSPDPLLADAEAEMLEKSNQLGIGPMGFGGATTLLSVKMAKMHRIPASFFVSTSYMCWASRRKSLVLKQDNTYIIE